MLCPSSHQGYPYHFMRRTDQIAWNNLSTIQYWPNNPIKIFLFILKNCIKRNQQCVVASSFFLDFCCLFLHRERSCLLHHVLQDANACDSGEEWFWFFSIYHQYEKIISFFQSLLQIYDSIVSQFLTRSK